MNNELLLEMLQGFPQRVSNVDRTAAMLQAILDDRERVEDRSLTPEIVEQLVSLSMDPDSFVSMYFHGGRGVGRTELSLSALRLICRQATSGAMITIYGVAEALAKSISESKSESQLELHKQIWSRIGSLVQGLASAARLNKDKADPVSVEDVPKLTKYTHYAGDDYALANLASMSLNLLIYSRLPEAKAALKDIALNPKATNHIREYATKALLPEPTGDTRLSDEEGVPLHLSAQELSELLERGLPSDVHLPVIEYLGKLRNCERARNLLLGNLGRPDLRGVVEALVSHGMAVRPALVEILATSENNPELVSRAAEAFIQVDRISTTGALVAFAKKQMA